MPASPHAIKQMLETLPAGSELHTMDQHGENDEHYTRQANGMWRHLGHGGYYFPSNLMPVIANKGYVSIHWRNS